ncbi:hypothetical protein PSQ90_07800 [Devosia rhodophyticola]|uniref:Uncharacterized protein n=1 Tax=Devosia rhodophyticola TaxID=3026423 RepID=A0ABY7Z108_9HYPH|nr:hypothetical protein [Devosia rhodophyticola]WDR07311.1 hypothetical protein PSQ90_07800 [Devosia rhodophyticola]
MSDVGNTDLVSARLIAVDDLEAPVSNLKCASYAALEYLDNIRPLIIDRDGHKYVKIEMTMVEWEVLQFYADNLFSRAEQIDALLGEAVEAQLKRRETRKKGEPASTSEGHS